MINKGFHNKTKLKAVPCDLVAKIIETKDNVLKILTEVEMQEYNNCYAEHFKNPLGSSDSLSECIEFLEYYDEGTENFMVNDVLMQFAKYELTKSGKYSGLCKLPSGADILVIEAISQEHGLGMCKVLYFDGKTLRFFTPYEGNTVDIINNSCLGDEAFAFVKESSCELYKQLIDDSFEAYMSMPDAYDGDRANKVVYTYLKNFGELGSELNIEDFDYLDVLPDLDFDIDAVCAEIEAELM